MSTSIIDAVDMADPSTYGTKLLRYLDEAKSNLEEYYTCERELDDDPSGSLARITRGNPQSDFYHKLTEEILLPVLKTKSVLAWHYTRLLPFEIVKIRQDGIRVTTFETLNNRINDLLERKLLTAQEVEAIISGSPLNDATQRAARLGKFWMVASRLSPSHHGVKPFLENWGGEAVYFWQADQTIKARLQSLGSPAIIEVVVPLSKTKHAFRAAQYIAERFACGTAHDSAFDLYVCEDLPNGAVRRVLAPEDIGVTQFGIATP